MKLSKYEDGEKKQNWQNNFKFSKRNPYVSNDEDLDLLTDKGVYPYDYFTSFDKFREKQGHARVFNLVSFVSSTAFRPVKYRSLCYWGKFSRRGAFRFHSFQFSEVRLQVCSDW